jgi:hypothetical protein
MISDDALDPAVVARVQEMQEEILDIALTGLSLPPDRENFDGLRVDAGRAAALGDAIVDCIDALDRAAGPPARPRPCAS